ncbi:MAG: hypothetical protein HZB09_01145 [Candidatus Yonathbacteria bacterium]|nr:hypothetical protein [Candidatus Yonathbacteria bacterium]
MDIQTIASSTALLMDVDGDGIIDTTIASGAWLSSQELIAILKGIIKTLNIPDKNKEKLIKKIEKLEKVIEKEFKNEYHKKQKTKNIFDTLIIKIKQLEKRGVLSSEETSALVDIIEKIKTSMVK